MSGLVFCCGKNTLAKVVFLRGTGRHHSWADSPPLLPVYNHRSGPLHSPRVSLQKPAHNTRLEQRPHLLVLTFPIIVLNKINSVGGHTTALCCHCSLAAVRLARRPPADWRALRTAFAIIKA